LRGDLAAFAATTHDMSWNDTAVGFNVSQFETIETQTIFTS
jgi:hypothetical protein